MPRGTARMHVVPMMRCLKCTLPPCLFRYAEPDYEMEEEVEDGELVGTMYGLVKNPDAGTALSLRFLGLGFSHPGFHTLTKTLHRKQTTLDLTHPNRRKP